MKDLANIFIPKMLQSEVLSIGETSRTPLPLGEHMDLSTRLIKFIHWFCETGICDLFSEVYSDISLVHLLPSIMQHNLLF
jgi:hypothetical protein